MHPRQSQRILSFQSSRLEMGSKQEIMKSPISHFQIFTGWTEFIFDKADLCISVMNDFNQAFQLKEREFGALTLSTAKLFHSIFRRPISEVPIIRFSNFSFFP